MTNKALISLTVSLILIVGSTTRAHADFNLNPLGLLGKAIVGDLLEEAEERATRVTKEAEKSGDALVSRASNELEVRLKQLRLLLKDMEKSTFGELSTLQKQLFISFNGVLEELNSQVVTSLNVKAEMRLIQLQQIVKEMPTLSPKGEPALVVCSLYGTTLAYDDVGPYRIRLTGYGPGFTKDQKWKVAAWSGGVELDDASIVRDENFSIQLKIPAKSVNRSFKKDRCERFPIQLKVTSAEKKEHSFEFKIVLLPIEAAFIKVTHEVQTFKWVQQPAKSILFTRPNDKVSDLFETTWECGPDERITSVAGPVTAPGNLGGFCYHRDPKRGYDLDATITADQRKVHIARRLGTAPVSVTHEIVYEKKQAEFTEEAVGEYLLRVDDPILIELDALRNPQGNFKITGKTAEGRALLLTSGMLAGRAQVRLRVDSFERVGNKYRMGLRLAPPQN